MVSSYPPKGNDPLLGLDSDDLVKEQQRDSKWAEVPKKRAGGFATATRPGAFGPEQEWRPGIWFGPAPELSVPSPEKQEDLPKAELPRAYHLNKPSILQRLLDWLLL